MTKLHEVTMTPMGLEPKEQAGAFRDKLLAAWEDIDAIAECAARLMGGEMDDDLTDDAARPLQWAPDIGQNTSRGGAPPDSS